MRAAALSVSALMLTACGGVGGDVTAPTEAPEGSSEMMAAFFEICGTALNDGANAAVTKAISKNWQPETDMDGKVYPVDIVRQYNFSHEDSGANINLYEIDDPYAKSMGCQFFQSSYDADEALLQPGNLEKLTGFDGRWMAIPDGGAGRWSKRSGNTLLSIFATQEGDKFSMVNMNKFTLK